MTKESRFKKLKEPYYSSNGWEYDLFSGGYLKPSMFYKNKEDIKKVEEAVKVIEDFIRELRENDLLEEG